MATNLLVHSLSNFDTSNDSVSKNPLYQVNNQNKLIQTNKKVIKISQSGIWNKIKVYWTIIKEWLWPVATMNKKVEIERIEKLVSAFDLELCGKHRGKKLKIPQTSIWTFKDDNSIGEQVKRMGPAFAGVTEESVTDVQYKECRTFIKGVLDLRDEMIKVSYLSREEGYLPLGSVDKIRKWISQLTENRVYLKLIDIDNPIINFLQILCIKLNTADGDAQLSRYARGRLGNVPKDMSSQEPQRHSMGQLADVLCNQLNQFRPTEKADSKPQWLLWACGNPLRVMNAGKSHLSPEVRKSFAIEVYLPHKGNPSYLGPKFLYEGDRGSKTIQAYYGAAPTGDRIFEFGLLPAYKKFNISEIYFNFQDMSEKREKERILQIEKISKDAGYFKHVVLGFETKVKNEDMKITLKNYQTVNQFFLCYKEGIFNGSLSETGFSIPKDLLTEEQLTSLFTMAETYFSKAGLDEILKNANKKTKQKYGEMMIMAIDAMICASILYKHFESISFDRDRNPDIDLDLQTHYVSARCKQHIDRGAVESNAMRLFYRLFEDDSYLTDQEFLEISGGILGRAQSVENRDILYRKYERFDTLMRFIGNDHKTLAVSLREYRNQFLISP
ncbi:MAG: hypothetical protein V4487_02575 [Chlamydiota bacterium]